MEENCFELYNFYRNIKKEKIVFCYCGPISQSTIEGIGSTLRLDLEMEEADMSTSQKIFSVFIEQMQNILNYSEEKIINDSELEKELRIGVLVIGEEGNNFYVYCGNKIYNKDEEKIKGRIDEISGLNQEELKALYKQRRKIEPQKGSKGAGLGLIEMARKSGLPIEYSFKKLDQEFSFFSIKVLIFGGKKKHG
jgi:hypothetical protein